MASLFKECDREVGRRVSSQLEVARQMLRARTRRDVRFGMRVVGNTTDAEDALKVLVVLQTRSLSSAYITSLSPHRRVFIESASPS